MTENNSARVSVPNRDELIEQARKVVRQSHGDDESQWQYSIDPSDIPEMMADFALSLSKGEEKVDGGNSADLSGSNYTADDDTFPTEVYFANGRKVGIAFDGDKPYLTVSAIEGGSYENKSK